MLSKMQAKPTSRLVWEASVPNLLSSNQGAMGAVRIRPLKPSLLGSIFQPKLAS